MILKSFLLEKNLSLIDNYNLILFYGENIGLKDEFKIGLKKKYYRYEQILFDQDEIIKNEKLLNDQVNNVSMFNDNKLIFINEISDKILPKVDHYCKLLKKKGFKFAHSLWLLQLELRLPRHAVGEWSLLATKDRAASQ